MSDQSEQRVFAIGDIHGCAKTFRKLLFEELRVHPEDKIICVGDYIDRGPDSKGVVDTILDLRTQDYDVITLRGNHEQIMLDSERSLESYLFWLRNGGNTTLNSFGVESYGEMPEEYRSFFGSTEFWYAWEHYLIVHAGLNFAAADPMSDTDAMLWTRENQVDKIWLGERVIVHGHTPIPKDVILKQEGQNINLDGGCVYANRQGMGWLVALELKTGQIYATRNVDIL